MHKPSRSRPTSPAALLLLLSIGLLVCAGCDRAGAVSGTSPFALGPAALAVALWRRSDHEDEGHQARSRGLGSGTPEPILHRQRRAYAAGALLSATGAIPVPRRDGALRDRVCPIPAVVMPAPTRVGVAALRDDRVCSWPGSRGSIWADAIVSRNVDRARAGVVDRRRSGLVAGSPHEEQPGARHWGPRCRAALIGVGLRPFRV